MKSVYMIMRVCHRYIGFFVLGLTLIYAFSGVILIYRKTDFLKYTVETHDTLRVNMSAPELEQTLKLKGLTITSENNGEIAFSFRGGSGTYQQASGELNKSSKQLPYVLKKFEKLHKTSTNDATFWLSTIYGVLMFYLAISALWMYRPKTQHFTKGMVVVGSGVAFALLLLWI